MKTIITFFLFAFTALTFSQEQLKTLNFEEFSITIDVDSMSDIEEINIDDVLEAFQEMEDYESYTFEINCNFSNKKDLVEVSNVSIKIESQPQEKEAFLEKIKKAKTVIHKMYNLN